MKTAQAWNIYKKERLSNVVDQKRSDIAWSNLSKKFSNVPVSKISQEMINSYCQERGVSNSTLRRELVVLKAAINWAYKTGHIPSVPYIQPPPEGKPRFRWLNQDEIRRLVDASEKHELKLFVTLMLSTGQRPGAVLGLDWKQVDLESGVIDFHTIGDGLQARRKGRGIVPVTDPLLSWLRSIQKQSGPVVAADGFRYRWERMTRDSGLEGVTPHTLRHSVATNLCRAGVPLIEISKLLGHKSTTITEKTYITFTPDYCKNAVNVMQGVISGV